MATRVRVWVTARAARDELMGIDGDGIVHIRVTAPPVDGKANAAVTKVLAAALGLPGRDVELVRGHTARTKVFDVELDPAEVDRLIPKLPSD